MNGKDSRLGCICAISGWIFFYSITAILMQRGNVLLYAMVVVGIMLSGISFFASSGSEDFWDGVVKGSIITVFILGFVLAFILSLPV